MKFAKEYMMIECAPEMPGMRAYLATRNCATFSRNCLDGIPVVRSRHGKTA